MLLLAAILGVITANSPIAEQYFSLMHIYLGPMDVLEWVNDGLMALFFLYVGIEIKTEMISGELNTKLKEIVTSFSCICRGGNACVSLLLNCWICTRIYAWLGNTYCYRYCLCNWCHYDAW